MTNDNRALSTKDRTEPLLQERRKAVSAAMDDIKTILAAGTSVENLTRAKQPLIDLAKRQDLFNHDVFPLPEDNSMENSYLIHEYSKEDGGGYALYINSGAPHQYYAPHDHGKAWAIIAGVQGRERHQLYIRRQKDDPGEGPIVHMGEFVVEPGSAVTMMPDGIHEVDIPDDQPLLHLHLYALNFEEQGERWKYDVKAGTEEPFFLNELGGIFDAR